MQFIISQSHEGISRTINVQVLSEAGKKMMRVRTTYDGFTEDDDQLNPPVSSYETVIRKQEGITPNQKHTVVVEAWHVDGTSDAGQKSWID